MLTALRKKHPPALIRALRSSPFFQALSGPEAALLAERLDVRSLESGAILYHKGDFPGGYFILLSGRLELYLDGGPAQISLLAGNVLGERDFLRGAPTTSTARAATPVEAGFISRAAHVELRTHFDLEAALGSQGAPRVAQSPLPLWAGDLLDS